MKRYLAHVKSWVFDDEFEEMTVCEIEVEKETPRKFYYKGVLRSKAKDADFGYFYSYHKTYAEAHAALIEHLSEKESDKLQRADLLQKEARELRAKIEELSMEKSKQGG